MKRSCILPATVFAITAGLSTATLADSSATLNQCWGDIASQMGQFGAMGLHSAASSPFNPTPAAGPNAPTNAGPRPLPSELLAVLGWRLAFILRSKPLHSIP